MRTSRSFGYGAVGVTGLPAMGLGVVLMFTWWAIEEEFFLNRTLPMRSSHDLVLAGPHVDMTAVRMPDSGLPEFVIAPDLSNLPPGAGLWTWSPARSTSGRTRPRTTEPSRDS